MFGVADSERPERSGKRVKAASRVQGTPAIKIGEVAEWSMAVVLKTTEPTEKQPRNTAQLVVRFETVPVIVPSGPKPALLK